MPDRIRSQRIGISSYTDNELVLDVIGKTNISGDIKVSGISTLGTIKISSGIISATTGVVTYYGDGSNLFGVTAFSVVQQDITNQVVYPTLANSIGVSSIGISTNKLVFNPSAGNLGIGTTNPTSKLTVDGDVRVTGILTVGSSSVTINGITDEIIVGSGVTISGTGNASYTGIVTAATFVGAVVGIASTATSLQTPRTFEITGDIVASPISFDGTGNVSLAATIQPNSVALGTDTTGDYVQTVSGTSNQITVTGGTGESSTPTLSIPNQFTAPQDVTVTRDLQVNRNLNVDGNITIGGTSATLFTQELKVFDPDIVLGIRTDAFGNDVSTDNTANHGGIAIASTEGTPLISLYDVGIGESNPATYKKIMWFKSGSFTGLNTDTWISNYPISIGTTQAQSGSRLTVGTGFTVYDTYVDAIDIRARNINASGVTTTGTLNVGVGGTIITTTGIGSVGIGSTQPGSTLVVNAPSGYTGNLLDLQVGGMPAFFTRRYDGGSGNATTLYIRANRTDGYYNYILSHYSGISFGTTNNLNSAPTPGFGNEITFGLGNNGLSLTQIILDNNASANINWANNVFLYKDGFGQLAQRNGTNAQTFRIYNTYTTSTNFERGQVGWTTNTFIVGTEKGSAGGSPRQLELQTDGTTRVAITTDGYVGIGTTNPTALLHLVGAGSSIKITGTTYDTLIDNSSTRRFFIGQPDRLNGIYQSSNGSISFITGGGAEYFGFTNGGQLNLNLDTSLNHINFGTFGNKSSIGRRTTNVISLTGGTQGQTFEIYNTYTTSTNFERANVGWTTNTFIVGTEKGSAGGSPRQLELQTDGTTRVAITTDGYVGIGSTQPTQTLDVVGNVKATRYYGEPEISPVMISMIF
jgi:hypothetical protein